MSTYVYVSKVGQFSTCNIYTLLTPLVGCLNEKLMVPRIDHFRLKYSDFLHKKIRSSNISNFNITKKNCQKSYKKVILDFKNIQIVPNFLILKSSTKKKDKPIISKWMKPEEPIIKK